MTRLAVCAVLALSACARSPAPPTVAPIVPVATDAPAGTYELDKAHASLIFRVNHLGFSHYTARFTRFDAQLEFDPARPGASHLTATIDPSSIETDYPDPATLDFNAELQNAQWLDVARFPAITFQSSKVEPTSPDTMRVHGDLGLHGLTRPVTLEVTFNGGYAGHPLDPRPRIGFSARGVLQRSAFGIAYGIPEPGTSMGVGDTVEVIIEAEFSQLAATPK